MTLADTDVFDSLNVKSHFASSRIQANNMKQHAWVREILVNKCKKLYVKCLVYKCEVSAQLILAWQLHCFIFREGQSDVMKNSGFTAHLKTGI